MIILLGSENPSKKRSLELALEELKFDDWEIITAKARSKTNSIPIGYEVFRGASNRNEWLREYAQVNNIIYDYLCSIEGGHTFDVCGHPFIQTYAIVETKEGRQSTGMSTGLRLTKEMFNYVRDVGSLNALINGINHSANNKYVEGITGFLSNGLLSRDLVDKDAIITAFVPIIFANYYSLLGSEVKNMKIKPLKNK